MAVKMFQKKKMLFKYYEEGKAWTCWAYPSTDEVALYQTPPLLQAQGLTSYSLRSWRSHPQEHPYVFLTIWKNTGMKERLGCLCAVSIFSNSLQKIWAYTFAHGCYSFIVTKYTLFINHTDCRLCSSCLSVFYYFYNNLCKVKPISLWG